MFTFAENNAVSGTTIAASAATSGGSAHAAVQLGAFETVTILVHVGTVTGGGSIAAIKAYEAQSTAAAAATVLTGGSLTSVGTAPGYYTIEIKADVLSSGNGTANTYVGASVIQANDATATYNCTYIRSLPRQAPVSNGLAGSAFLLT